MSVTTLASNLLRSRNRQRRRSSQVRRPAGPTRLSGAGMEALEDRRLLAVTVGNGDDIVNGDVSSIAALVADDGGDGISLREAIDASNNTAGADEIEFAPTVIGNISLTNGQLAVTDELTQLANRRIFDESLRKEWLRMRREQHPLSVIIGDIDFFKRYNDYYGHQKGDACLKAVAECIKSSVHRSTDIVARYGGEEFVVLLPNTPSDGAFRVAEKMRTNVASMNREHTRSKVQNYVTISLGVATLVPPMDGGNPEKLVKMADDALYASKDAGRNLVMVKKPG